MKKSTLKLLGLTLGLLLLGLLVGMGLGRLDAVTGLMPPKAELNAWYFVYLIGSLYMVLAVHELGHLVAGLLQGFDFQLFVLGFLGIRKGEKGGVKLYFNREMQYHGGVAATVPARFEPALADTFARVILAGPLASLGLCVLALALVPWVPHPLRFICLTVGLMSLAIFFATTLPSRTGPFYSDRKRYQRLKQPGPAQEIEMALMQAIALKQQNRPITEMAAADLEKMTLDPAPLFQYTGLYYLYEYHLGNQPEQQAIRARMQPLEADLPATFVKQMHQIMAELEQTPA